MFKFTCSLSLCVFIFVFVCLSVYLPSMHFHHHSQNQSCSINHKNISNLLYWYLLRTAYQLKNTATNYFNHLVHMQILHNRREPACLCCIDGEMSVRVYQNQIQRHNNTHSFMKLFYQVNPYHMITRFNAYIIHIEIGSHTIAFGFEAFIVFFPLPHSDLLAIRMYINYKLMIKIILQLPRVISTSLSTFLLIVSIFVALYIKMQQNDVYAVCDQRQKIP